MFSDWGGCTPPHRLQPPVAAQLPTIVRDNRIPTAKKATTKKAAPKKAAPKKAATKKSSTRKYSPAASKSVETEMHAMKRGELKSGSGQTVTNPKQAIDWPLGSA